MLLNEIFSTWRSCHPARPSDKWQRECGGKIGVRIAARSNIYFASSATKRPPIARTFIDSSRFLRASISGLICFQVDRRHRHWGTRRISDIESTVFPNGILPRHSENPTNRNRKESHRFWDGRAVIDDSPDPPVISGFTRCIRRHLLRAVREDESFIGNQLDYN